MSHASSNGNQLGRELFASIAKGSQVASVASVLLPILEELKEKTFQEFALAANDAMSLSKAAGKAELVNQLIRECELRMDEAKSAQASLTKEKH